LTENEEEMLAILKEKRAKNPQQRVSARLFFADILERPSLSSELAILRRGEQGQVEMYLFQRPPNDPFYANQWHGPGCMLKTNQTVAEGIDEVMKRELGVVLPGVINTSKYFEWLTGNGPGQCPRGHTVCFYHYVWVDAEQAEKLSGGEFFPVETLPEPMVEVHTRMITWLKNEL
jgi:ADP-ribose pyrophosphatase YjhB (NUDIX family)